MLGEGEKTQPFSSTGRRMWIRFLHDPLVMTSPVDDKVKAHHHVDFSSFFFHCSTSLDHLLLFLSQVIWIIFRYFSSLDERFFATCW